MEPTPPAQRSAPDAPFFRLAHLSDIHFGKIAHERVVPALVEEVNDGGLDLVVISGDLTQRARTSEYEAARAMIDAFRPPVLVVPGNHDVRAWWHNPFERIFRSASRFRRFIGDDTTPSFAADGVAAFGLNSAHGLTIKGGKIRPRHLDRMRTFFEAQPPEAFRVLVVHHHLTRLRALGSHDIAHGAKKALQAAGSANVELLLCGHLHMSHVENVEIDVELGQRIVIASAGTATSSRGRGTNRDVNFYNHVCVWPDHFTVAERRFVADAGAFEPARETRFERVTEAV
ncbi:MAG: metallophosphoesterase [Rhodothermales bacterium]